MSEPTDPRGLLRDLTETDEGLARVIPGRNDFDAVFLDGDSWAGAWAEAFPEPPELDRPRGRVLLDVVIGRLDDPSIADLWPGGMRELTPAVREGTVFCQWTYRSPGATHGVTFNALAWTGERWVWLPKPWRWAPVTADGSDEVSPA